MREPRLSGLHLRSAWRRVRLTPPTHRAPGCLQTRFVTLFSECHLIVALEIDAAYEARAPLPQSWSRAGSNHIQEQFR